MLWIGTRAGLNRLDRHQETFRRYIHDSQSQTRLNSNVISSIYEDHNGVLWVGTWAGLYSVNRWEGNLASHVLDRHGARHLIWGIVEDRMNTLWIVTSGAGLYRYDPRTGVAHNFRNDVSDPHSLSSDLLTFICQAFTVS